LRRVDRGVLNELGVVGTVVAVVAVLKETSILLSSVPESLLTGESAGMSYPDEALWFGEGGFTE
jgi:hypothetical protein